MLARAGLEDAALHLLDRGRAALLGRLATIPGVARLRRRRDLRLTLSATVSVLAALVLAVRATGPLLSLSPLLLGVPHVASDVRYLLLRRAGKVPAVAGPAVFVLLALSMSLGLLQAPRLAGAAGAGAVLWVALSAAEAGRTRMLVLLAAVLLGAVAMRWPGGVQVALAQGHNFVALALAGWLVRGRLGLPGALLAAGVVTLAGGAADPWLAAAPQASLAVVPAGLGEALTRRWVAVFAFAQSVHYGAWVAVVPDALRASERPVSFRRSWELLEADLGRAGARTAVLLSVGLPLLACLSLEQGRRFYLGFSVFHGYIELAVVAALLLGRRR